MVALLPGYIIFHFWYKVSNIIVEFLDGDFVDGSCFQVLLALFWPADEQIAIIILSL